MHLIIIKDRDFFFAVSSQLFRPAERSSSEVEFSYARGRKWRLGFTFHLFSCWNAEVLPGMEDEDGTQDLQRGRFNAPTQVTPLFIKDA